MLKAEIKRLSQDLILFLKEEGHIIEKKVVKEAHLPPPPPPKKAKKEVETAIDVPPPPKQRPILREETTPLFDQIKKHLPHIKLTQTIPGAKKAALVVYDLEDLSFLKNLAGAIQERFCPVSLIDGNKVEPGRDWSPFFLVLAQKGGAVEADIFLEKASVYEANRELKKQLWNTLCLRLSSKSS